MRRLRRSRLVVGVSLALLLPALAGITGTAAADEATTDPAGSAATTTPQESSVPLQGTDPADQPPEGAEDGIPVGGAQRTADPSGASITAAATAADATRRYFGSGPWAAIKNAATAQSKCSGLTTAQLQAMVLSTIFLESAGATTPSSIPAPMTLSRYDEWSGIKAGNLNINANYGLYAFRSPSSPYRKAFWHPGIGIWQYDSAGIGAPYTAAERISTTFLAPKVAAGMANRYCASDAGNGPGKRYDAWLPWYLSCDTNPEWSGPQINPNATLCEQIYQGLIQTNFGNVTVQSGFSATGGAVKHSCVLTRSGDSHPCWRIDPSRAQGATWWATATPLDGGAANRDTSPITPIAAPFYVIKQGGIERRYWLSADTGYSRDITGTRTLGKNARPKDNQAGSGVTWDWGTGLCDVSTGRGDCATPFPPQGITLTKMSVHGTYRPVVLDLNGDGKDDVLWYAPGAAADSFWMNTGFATFRPVATRVIGDYEVLAGELTGNGKEDLVLYSTTTGELHLWRSSGNGEFAKVTMNLEPDLVPILLDEDGNGIDELVLHGGGTQRDHRIWWNGKQFADKIFVVSGTYRPFVGDFDGNGRDDIFWYAPGRAADSIWLRKRAGGYLTVPVTVNGTDHAPVVGDLDGDGRDDIVFKSPSSDGGAVWFGGPNGNFITISTGGAAGIVPVIADLDGNGRNDLVYVGPGAINDHLLRFATNRTRTSSPLTLTGTQQVLPGRWTAGHDGLFWYGPGDQTDWLWWR